MRDVRIGAAQFEARDGDKAYNFGRIEALARRAVYQAPAADRKQDPEVRRQGVRIVLAAIARRIR